MDRILIKLIAVSFVSALTAAAISWAYIRMGQDDHSLKLDNYNGDISDVIFSAIVTPFIACPLAFLPRFHLAGLLGFSIGVTLGIAICQLFFPGHTYYANFYHLILFTLPASLVLGVIGACFGFASAENNKSPSDFISLDEIKKS